MNDITKYTAVFMAAVVLMAVSDRAMSAEFTMNFQPNAAGVSEPGSGSRLMCNIDSGGTSYGMCNVTMGGYLEYEETPFVMEMVEVNGVDYFHVIVGDPAQGFAQEFYVTGARTLNSGIIQYAADYADAFNAGSPGTGPLTGPGNASANPSNVVMRQVIGGEWDAATTTWTCGATGFCSEFLKDTLLEKPNILQVVRDGDMTSTFVMDMRALDYTSTLGDMPAAPITNTLTFSDSPHGAFDMATDASVESSVSGGRYIYEEGLGGWGSEGSYTYADGDFDLDAVAWEDYRSSDPAINPIPIENAPDTFNP